MWARAASASSASVRESSSAAAPNAIAAATFSSPARRARSWSPPSDERVEPQAASHEQRADARWTAELGGVHRHQVDTRLVERDRHVPSGRGGIDVEQHTALSARDAHLVDRLERCHLVVGELAVHERDVAAEQGRQMPDRDAPVRIDVGRAHLAVTRRGLAHGGVFDRRGDERAARRARRRAETRGVDRLARAAREHDLAWTRAEQRRHPFAGVLQGGTRHTPFGVHAPGIASDIEPLEHRRAPRPVAEAMRMRGRDRRGSRRYSAQESDVTHDVPPMARELSVTGIVSPYKPASMPRTMPRSTAHMTGWSWAAAPNGH